jgi:hypothetical protein
MKKIVLNISDSTYEKLRFEALQERKDVQTLIRERLFFKPFSKEVEAAFDEWIEKEISNITGEKK